MDELSPADPVVDPRRYFEGAAGARRATSVRKPVCLYLETTNRCDLLCTTCPRTYEELEPPADMSWSCPLDRRSGPGHRTRGPARRRRADAGRTCRRWCAT